MTTEDILCQHDITPSCTDSSYSKCPHCSLDLCLEHINEHQMLVRIDFNEVIDRINQQKSRLSDHSAVDKMRTKSLGELDNWKMTKIEAVMTVYHTERLRIDKTCDECIDETSSVQSRFFEELNAASSALEKKKNIHPYDIAQLEQKLHELNMIVNEIEQNTDVDLTSIVTEIKLPEMIELEQQLKDQANVEKMVKQCLDNIEMKDRTIRTRDNELRRLQQTIDEKDQNIDALRQRPRKFK